MLRFDVYGRVVGIRRTDEEWTAMFVGGDGKHRPAPEVVIPPWVTEDGLARFLADLFHEASSPERPDVIRLPDGSGASTQGP